MYKNRDKKISFSLLHQMVTACGMQALYGLFSCQPKPSSVNAELNAQIITVGVRLSVHMWDAGSVWTVLVSAKTVFCKRRVECSDHHGRCPSVCPHVGCRLCMDCSCVSLNHLVSTQS